MLPQRKKRSLRQKSKNSPNRIPCPTSNNRKVLPQRKQKSKNTPNRITCPTFNNRKVLPQRKKRPLQQKSKNSPNRIACPISNNRKAFPQRRKRSLQQRSKNSPIRIARRDLLILYIAPISISTRQHYRLVTICCITWRSNLYNSAKSLQNAKADANKMQNWRTTLSNTWTMKTSSNVHNVTVW